MSNIILGIVFGSLIGLILVFVALSQQFPKWRKQGFSKARTQEEYKIVKNYYSDSEYRKRLGFYSKKYAVPIVLLILAISWVWNISIELILSVFVSFVIIFLSGYLLSALLIDRFIRSKKN